MDPKTKEFAQLLRKYRRTGDEDYRRAAECLKIPLMDFLELLSKRPGRRGATIGHTAHGRLLRMTLAIERRQVANPHAAASQEVENSGYAPHPSKASAIDYLRHKYADRKAELKEEARYLLRVEREHNQFSASTLALHRAAQQALPPAWAYAVQHHVLPSWIREIGATARNITR
jgi:hypothetical protein